MLENIYNQKITILNKLRRTDNDNKTDVWFKHTVDNVVWYTDSARSAGSHDVFIGSYITILIPFSDEYLPYKQWKDKVDRENYYTISVGDYIIAGDVPEDVNASNIVKVTEKYGEDVCLVRHHNENYHRFGARVQLKIEGV